MKPNLHFEHPDVLGSFGQLKVIDPYGEIRHLNIVGIDNVQVLSVQVAELPIKLDRHEDAHEIHRYRNQADVAL